ncbi:hypothetical protein ACH4PU_32645 [Streptomyces sp. NPDC021100]|uniref:hypothetical protein n=1 Tax=Streptomyces sp. NPDC021100 TaxID=3365114 RepID=UPI00378E0FD1
MSRERIVAAFAAAPLILVGLTGCSSDSADESGISLTKQFSQGEIAQALPGDGEVLPGWESYRGKRVISEGMYCTESANDASPKGWVRGGSAWFILNGSTKNMMEIDVCTFDTPNNAKSAYTAWKGTEPDKEKAPIKAVGDEAVLVVNPGLSKNSVEGFSRSGHVNIRVKVQGTGGDTTGTQDMLAAVLGRLQQVQDGKRATVTAGDESAEEAKK